MGNEPKDIDAAKQTGLTVTPTRTIYTFDAAGVTLALSFTTPLLPDDLMLCARPITYRELGSEIERRQNARGVRLSRCRRRTGGECIRSDRDDRARIGRRWRRCAGTVDQAVLETRGDDVRIDWGYFYLAANAKTASLSSVCAGDGRKEFAKSGKVVAEARNRAESSRRTRRCLRSSISLGNVGDQPISTHALLAYDDVSSIRYFNDDLRPYWKRNGATIDELLQTAEQRV